MDKYYKLSSLVQDTLQRAHSQPHSASTWYLLACVALHYAASTHQATAHRSALALCNHALHLLNSTAKSEQHNGQDQTTDHVPQQQQQQQVKLQCMRSECCLHTRQTGSSDQAMSSAKAAVRAATGLQDAALTAAALQQLSRYALTPRLSCYLDCISCLYCNGSFPMTPNSVYQLCRRFS